MVRLARYVPWPAATDDDPGRLRWIPALAFALAPLQRFARSVADAAMPPAQDPDAMDDDERITVYRRQAEVAWADGALSADERALLDELRDQLGIDAEVASEVESKVAQRGGGDV